MFHYFSSRIYNFFKYVSLFAFLFILIGCRCNDSYMPKISVVRISDRQLNCSGLYHAIAEMKALMQNVKVRCSRPNLFSPYPACIPWIKQDAARNFHIISDRANYLDDLYKNKKCGDSLINDDDFALEQYECCNNTKFGGSASVSNTDYSMVDKVEEFSYNENGVVDDINVNKSKIKSDTVFGVNNDNKKYGSKINNNKINHSSKINHKSTKSGLNDKVDLDKVDLDKKNIKNLDNDNFSELNSNESKIYAAETIYSNQLVNSNFNSKN